MCSLCMRVVVACRVMAAEEAHASVRKEDGTPSTYTTIPPARAALHPRADELAAADSQRPHATHPQITVRRADRTAGVVSVVVLKVG